MPLVDLEREDLGRISWEFPGAMPTHRRRDGSARELRYGPHTAQEGKRAFRVRHGRPVFIGSPART